MSEPTTEAGRDHHDLAWVPGNITVCAHHTYARLDCPGCAHDAALVAAGRAEALGERRIADAFHDALCPVSHHDRREVYAAAMGTTQPCRVKYDEIAAALTTETKGDGAFPSNTAEDWLHD